MTEEAPNDALRRKLAAEHATAEASWGNLSEIAVYAKVRALRDHPMRPILGRMLAAAVRRHAPQHLGLLPPEFLEATDDRSAPHHAA